MRILSILAAALAVMTVSAGEGHACGPESDCMIGTRSYRIALPQSNAMGAQIPAIVFAHGYRGTAAGVMRNKALRGLAEDLGAALIAVQSDGPGWELPNNPRNPENDGAAEFAYFDAVLEDAAERFFIDVDRVLATGFSGGGMMVWNLACARPERYAGFIPVAGTFWRDIPETCSRPVADIIHIHGDTDTVVPLKGRPIGATRQGDVAAVLDRYAAFGAFGAPETISQDDLRCAERRNQAGNILSLCRFAGGHSFRTEHLRYAIGRLREVGRF